LSPKRKVWLMACLIINFKFRCSLAFNTCQVLIFVKTSGSTNNIHIRRINLEVYYKREEILHIFWDWIRFTTQLVPSVYPQYQSEIYGFVCLVGKSNPKTKENKMLWVFFFCYSITFIFSHTQYSVALLV